MDSEEIFVKVNLPVAGEAVILESKGIHFFNALLKANGNSVMMVKFLITELVLINNKKITEEMLNAMHIRDINYISTVIDTMLQDDHKNLM